MAYLKLVRYKNLIIIALLQILLRYGLIIPVLHKYGIEPALSTLNFILLVVSTVLLAASGYVINDYFDIRTDRINKPDNVIVGKKIKRRVVLLLHVLLSFTGVFIGLYLAYITRKENYVLMYIIVPAILWSYSTTFKKQVLIGNLAIAFLTAIVPYLVVSLEFAALQREMGREIIYSPACSLAWFWTTGFAFFAFITTLTREIIKDIQDIPGDKAIGCKTLPIEIGIPYSKTIVIILSLGSVIAVWLLYFLMNDLRNIPYSGIYLAVFITIPYLYLIYTVINATEPKDFKRASSIGKWIIFFGVLFIAMAGYNFR
ncbi:MAG: UbiA family prenyltransferase [Chlorobi bacterium]|nr:UbiA family prenyltransferase [Chlorobiota bacterium]